LKGIKSGDGTKCDKKRTLLSLSLSFSLSLEDSKQLAKFQNGQ
jgi:hypothetical protein